MHATRTSARWLAGEVRLLLAAARAPLLWAALGAALAAWGLAYQAAAAHTLHIGGDPATRLRWYDAPFLDGFNDPEPARSGVEWHALPGPPYRWAEERAEVLLPGMGGGPWIVSVVAGAGPRPGGVESRWQLGDAAPLAVAVPPGDARIYRVLGPDTAGDVRLRLSTPPVPGLSDPRSLGLVIYRVSVAQAGSAPRAPAAGALALLLCALAGAYALARRAWAQPWRVAAVIAAAAAGIAYLLAARRADIAIFAPALAGLAWACYALAALLQPLAAAAAARLGVRPASGEVAAAAAAAAAAFGLRMAGMLHPYHRFSDTGLHVNNLLGVALRGSLLFTEGLPCEAGGGQSPYPPGPYLLLAPGALVSGGERAALTLLSQGGTALLESLSGALVWLALRRAGLGGRAALAGAALYIFAPPLLQSYAVGEIANLAAQALLVPLLLFLAAGAPAAGGRAAALGGALLAALLLSHTGVSISTATLLAAWAALAGAAWLVRRRRGSPAATGSAWRLLAAGAAAGAVALALYYSAYGGLFAERRALAAAQAALPADQRCPPDSALADRLWRWGAAPIVGARPLLPAPLLAAGAAGAALLASGAGRRRALGLTLAACWLGTALSFATLLGGDQAVRWQPFLFPALCLGAGAALAAWRRRGRAGPWLAWGAAAYLAWHAAAGWVGLIADYLH